MLYLSCSFFCFKRENRINSIFDDENRPLVKGRGRAMIGVEHEGNEKKPKVLVVDDEPQIIDFLEMGFTYEGFQVFSARSGPEAVQAAAEHQPDIVILDIMLPGWDGLEVTQRIRKVRDVAIIMLTAKDEVDDRVAGL